MSSNSITYVLAVTPWQRVSRKILPDYFIGYTSYWYLCTSCCTQQQLCIIKVFLPPVLEYPDRNGLAWDWISQKLYWTDESNEQIDVLDTVGGHRRVLLKTGLYTQPRDIVVDPTTRYNLLPVCYRESKH